MTTSNGVLLSNFAPTADTSTRRVAAFYDGFKGLRNYSAPENVAKWSYRDHEALTTVARHANDHDRPKLAVDSPLPRLSGEAPRSSGSLFKPTATTYP